MWLEKLGKADLVYDYWVCGLLKIMTIEAIEAELDHVIAEDGGRCRG